MTDLLTELDCVELFMRKGEQRFNPEQAIKQLGFVCEELAEGLTTVAAGALATSDADSLRNTAQALTYTGGLLKKGMHTGDLMRADQAQLIDDFIDMAWVALGGLLCMTNHAHDAFREVARANIDKFRNGVVKDVNGKVMKPSDWVAPDLTQFVKG